MRTVVLIALGLLFAPQAAHAQGGSVDAQIDQPTARVGHLEGTRAVKKL